ncbi:MAG: hypothetical protein ABI467_24210 [Kofleriaceae bacterium]
MLRWVLLVFVVGCHPYLSGGLEMSSKLAGPIATMMQQPVASARGATAFADAPTVLDTTQAPARTYSVAVGSAPARDFHIELGLHAHDISSDSLEMSPSSSAYLASPRFLTATTSLDFQWFFLRTHHVATYIHVGPAAGAIIDKSDGSRSFGQAVRFGGGIQIDLPVVRVFLDASQTELMMTSGPAAGVNELAGITLGVGLH